MPKTNLSNKGREHYRTVQDMYRGWNRGHKYVATGRVPFMRERHGPKRKRVRSYFPSPKVKRGFFNSRKPS